MKPAVQISRVLVGVLFIFSGLVKANDPLGLSYKMQEFFDLWGMSRFDDYTLFMSVLMNAFEIIAGFALLVGWRIRLFSWLLLILIVFFTFLTGYAYLSGKFKSCGCFGDCIPITPGTSFVKDLVLLVLIAFLFWQRDKIKPIFSPKVSMAVMFAFTVFSFGCQWYTLQYLPVADCLAFKKGNNIPEKMQIPPGARPDSFAIRFVYEKGGKQYEFASTELPSDLATYKFVSRVDKLIRKGNAEPAIRGFVLSGITNEDSTQYVLSRQAAILIFCEDFSVPVSKWEKTFTAVYQSAKSKNIPVYMITGRPDEAAVNLKGKAFSDIQVLKCDITAIRTAARTNPCIYMLENGTIKGKWSYHSMKSVQSAVENLKAIPAEAAIPVEPVMIPDTLNHD